ncbi:MAG TPA: PEGA domain-containing protein, partial [Polyangiaceae bacterium]|nr:PEGA domain-containing protein [Polyangiaceae bacterium]
DPRELYTSYPTQYPTYPPAPPPQHGSVPPMALDPEPRPQGSGWSKLAAVTSGLVLVCLVATVAFFLVPRTGTLRVELEHDGIAPTRAEIYVDGQKRCDIDPCVVSDLEPGTRSIKVLVAGAEAAVESEGEVARGETRVVTVQVSFAQGIRARAHHKGVRVWVDGEKRGTLPVELSDLSPGAHQLRFEAGDRFGEVTRSVEVPAGRVVDLGEIELEVRKVGLQIELGTPDAKVQLVDPEGKVSTVSGPFPAKIDLSPGRYRLVGSKPGYAPQAETLVLGKEPTHTIRLELSPQRFRPRASVLSLEDLLRILPPPSSPSEEPEEPSESPGEPPPAEPPPDVIEGTTQT